MPFRWWWQRNSATKEDLQVVKEEILATIQESLNAAPQKTAPTFVDYEQEDNEKTDEDLVDLKNYYQSGDSIVDKALISNNTLTVLTKDGDLFSASNATKDLYKKVLQATDLSILVALLQPSVSYEEIE